MNVIGTPNLKVCITDGCLEDSETDDSNTPSESESLVEPMD